MIAGVWPSAGTGFSGKPILITPNASGAITVIDFFLAMPKLSFCWTSIWLGPGVRLTPMYSQASSCFSARTALVPTRSSGISFPFTVSVNGLVANPFTLIDVCAIGKISPSFKSRKPSEASVWGSSFSRSTKGLAAAGAFGSCEFRWLRLSSTRSIG